MSKIQTIICLFVFLIVLFSMDMIFGNPLKETFSGIAWNNALGVGIASSNLGRGVGIEGVGNDFKPSAFIQPNQYNGNMLYETDGGFLGATPPKNYKPQYTHYKSDDQPLHFGFH